MIRIKGLNKSFGTREIIKDFSVTLPNNGIVSLVGHSGCGKTTLLNMIAGVDQNYDGEISIDNINLKNLSENELSEYRLRNIGFVFQNFNLFNLQSVAQNVAMPLDACSNSPKGVKKKRVIDALNLLSIKELAKKPVNKLSGGEKQRVAIARAIINSPKVVLCDEPTGALDEKNSENIFNFLKEISNTTLVIIATHDLESARKYSGKLIYFDHSSIKEEDLNTNNCSVKPLLINIKKKDRKLNLSTHFKINHAIQKNRSKKYRSLIMNMMLSLSLTGVGLSLIVKDSVSKKINTAFSEILNGNQIIMNLKGENGGSFNASYSASKEHIYKIHDMYTSYFDGVGVNYLVNFEDFFRDKNEFKIVSQSNSYIVPSFSARNINDFKLLKDNKDGVYYPVNINNLENDEVVLGIPYVDMVNICFALRIQRNYTTLGHYLYENDVNFVLNVENSNWQYNDEQIFKVKAVCESESCTIYHSNQFFNEFVFEECMRLPSDDNSTHEYPWEMEKIYYLRTKEDCSKFLNASLYDDELNDYVFERTNEKYNPLLCGPNRECNEKRVYAYFVDKNAINLADLKTIKKDMPELRGYFLTSGFGYSSFGSNIFSGFSKNVFVSMDETKIDDAIDADTAIGNNNNLIIDLPSGIVQGNFLNSLGNGLRFSTRINNLIYGRLPRNNNEIVVSSGLAEKLGGIQEILGKYMVFAGDSDEIVADGKLIKTYRKTKILITGINEENKNYLYHSPDWTISFFRDKLGVSNFNLLPSGVVFELDEKIDTKKIVNLLSQKYRNYEFQSPLDVITDNINSTLEYANTILMAFSILSIVISVLLLCTIILLNIIESKDEILLFKYLGIKKSDVNSTFVYQSLFQGLLSLAFSIVELAVVDQIISYFLDDYLNISFKISVNLLPFAIVILIGILMPILVARLMLLLLNIKRRFFTK